MDYFLTSQSEFDESYTKLIMNTYEEGFGAGYDDGYSIGVDETKLKLAIRLYLRHDFSAEQISELVDLPLNEIYAGVIKKDGSHR